MLFVLLVKMLVQQASAKVRLLMSRTRYLAVGAVVILVAGATWQNPPLLFALLKNIFIAFVLARMAAHFHICNCNVAPQLGMGLWIGFQSVLLISAVLHDRMPWALYAIHSAASQKTLMMSVVLGISPG
jgi:hypothetical protein